MKTSNFHKDEGFFKSNLMRSSYVDAAVIWQNFAVAIAFIMMVVPVLYKVVLYGSASWAKASMGWRSYFLFVGILLTAGPVLWNWWESTRFYEWVYWRFPKDKDTRDREITIFNMHSGYAKSLWAGVLALIAAAILKFQ